MRCTLLVLAVLFARAAWADDPYRRIGPSVPCEQIGQVMAGVAHQRDLGWSETAAWQELGFDAPGEGNRPPDPPAMQQLRRMFGEMVDYTWAHPLLSPPEVADYAQARCAQIFFTSKP